MADFSLTLTASPDTPGQHRRAQRFARAAMAAGHRLRQVFFYQDAVLVVSAGVSEELCGDWSRLASDAECPLYVCVSAAERRGITDCSAPWEIVGLGDWVVGLESERHLHFGNPA